MKRFLVLTAEERLWPTDKPILFLGRWCLLHEKKNLWGRLNYKLAKPYGVKLEEKERDNKHVEYLINSILAELVGILNKYHGLEKTERYWKILLGEWLIRYTALFINRHNTLKQTIEDNESNLAAVYCATNFNVNLAVKDTLNFTLASSDINWNTCLYGMLIRDLRPNIPIINESIDIKQTWATKENSKLVAGKYSSVMSFTSRCKYILEKVLTRLTPSSNGLIINSYLNKSFLIKFFIYLFQIPRKYLSFRVDQVESDVNIRKSISFKNIKENDFDSLYKKFLIKMLPTCFLEGYSNLEKNVVNLPWQNAPAFIFTSNNYCYDEVFQMYAAEKTHNGSKLFIGQHGANFGVLKFCHSEQLCKQNADKLITWAWSDHPNCAPAFFFQMADKKRNLFKKCARNGLLLIQLRIRPSIDTWDNYHEFDVYMNEQFSFIDNLCFDAKSELTVRLHSASSYDNWGTLSKWEDRFPELIFDQGETHFREIIGLNKLLVFTYLSTGFNQMLYMNQPVVIFWNDEIEILRDSATDVFQKLNEAKVLFYDPIEAAKHINNIWHDVDGWWSSEKVQHAIEVYCDRFSRSRKAPYKILKSILKGS